MAFTKKNEEAVSPVIGVILMVAITVILAAVIAAFVFGMAGNISKTKVVAMTVQKTSSTTIRVVNMGGQDASALTNATVTTLPVSVCDPILMGGAETPMNIGCTTTCTGVFPGKTQVTVVGKFLDQSEQVLIDTQV